MIPYIILLGLALGFCLSLLHEWVWPDTDEAPSDNHPVRAHQLANIETTTRAETQAAKAQRQQTEQE